MVAESEADCWHPAVHEVRALQCRAAAGLCGAAESGRWCVPEVHAGASFPFAPSTICDPYRADLWIVLDFGYGSL